MTSAAAVANLAEAFAPCTTAQRQQANGHLNEVVTVGGRQALLQAYIPVSGNSADRIKVTFPAQLAGQQNAPANVQTMINGLTFQAQP